MVEETIWQLVQEIQSAKNTKNTKSAEKGPKKKSVFQTDEREEGGALVMIWLLRDNFPFFSLLFIFSLFTVSLSFPLLPSPPMV